MFALELRKVTKRYGTVVAVDGLSLEVPEHSIFGLIGPNGAGKTTTFGLLSGFLRPTEGEILVRGQRLGPAQPRVGLLSALPQDAELPRGRPVLELLAVLGEVGGLRRAEAKRRAEEILVKLGLAGLERRTITALSHGQRRRVELAQALLSRHDVLLLDEPTSGLDPLSAAELRQLIESLRGERTIVWSSHNLSEIESLCDRAAILARGKLVVAGSMDELRRSSGVVTIALTAALPPNHPVLERIQTLPGVRSVELKDENQTLELSLWDEGPDASDAITSRVLEALLASQILIRSVERGTSLEQRLVDEVSLTSGR